MKKGFVVSGILYPLLILFLCFVLLILSNLAQTYYKLRKVTTDITLEVNGDDPKGKLKYDMNQLLKDVEKKENCITNYQVRQGKIDPLLHTSVDMTNWNGRFYDLGDEKKAIYIDNGELCGYKLTSQSNFQIKKVGIVRCHL